MSLYLLAEAGNLLMTGAAVGSVWPGGAASPPATPTLPWWAADRNAPPNVRLQPPVATASLPGLLGSDPIGQAGRLGLDEAGGIDLTPGQQYAIEIPPWTNTSMPIGSQTGSILASLTSGGEWRNATIQVNGDNSFTVFAVYSGAPQSNVTPPPGWIYNPIMHYTGTGVGQGGPAPAPTPPAAPPPAAPPPLTSAQPLPTVVGPAPSAPPTVVPITPVSVDTTGAPSSGSAPPSGMGIVLGAGAVLALLYFGRKKKRGR